MDTNTHVEERNRKQLVAFEMPVARNDMAV